MPNIKSAKKRVLVNATKAMNNQMAKSALKTTLKKFDAAVAGGDKAQAAQAYATAVKAVYQAQRHGLRFSYGNKPSGDILGRFCFAMRCAALGGALVERWGERTEVQEKRRINGDKSSHIGIHTTFLVNF